mmetsp:Transcript_6179/g.8173  ORF Transcript_6179/g.8173 Transcript_6179/m.8173 type:complete len:102 (-) Transcript_6179:160-465(-)
MKLQDEKNIRGKGIFYGMALIFIHRNRNALKNLKNSRMNPRYRTFYSNTMVEFEEGRGLIMQEHTVKSSSFDNRSVTNPTIERISPMPRNHSRSNTIAFET